MAVRWTKIYETSTTGKMPTTSAVTWSEGINSGGGLVEFLQLRYNLTFDTTSPVATGEVSNLVSNFRVVCNGEVVFDFNAGATYTAAGGGASQFNYLLNHIGGRVVEDPNSANDLVRTGYFNIPLGRNLPQGVNRWEIIVNWAASNGAITSGDMSYWLRYNPNTAKTTTVVPATSFLSAANAIEQVVVRVPQNTPKGSVVTAIAVFNDSEADEYGTQGLRINALSDFGIPISMYRSSNGDSRNGIMWNKGSTNADDVQSYATRLSGAIVIPTLGLTGGDVVMVVDSTAATTRRYCPILTAPVGGKSNEPVRQTQGVKGNTAAATLDGSLM
tara:strand:- start:505 stop:1494 length:990 start_codon:yes stop_codon:yes gene_type:complete